MDEQKIQYPCYTRALAQWSNELNQTIGHSFSLNIQKQIYAFELSIRTSLLDEVVGLDVSIGDGDASIYLNNNVLSMLLEGDIPPQAFSDLPEELQFALIEVGLLPSIQFLKEELDTQLVLHKVYTLDSAELDGAMLCLTLHSSEQHQSGQILISPSSQFAGVLSQKLTALAGQVPPLTYGYLPLPASIEVGKTEVSQNTYNTLEVGDIIVFDHFYTSEQGYKVNIAQQKMFMGIINHDRLTATTKVEPLMLEESTKPEDAQDTPEQLEEETAESNDIESDAMDSGQQEEVEPATPQTSTVAANLPIQLSFVAGRLQLSVSELEKIQPGYVLDLGRVAQGHIEICANGTTIGNGELVQIDDHVGVKCLKLLGQ